MLSYLMVEVVVLRIIIGVFGAPCNVGQFVGHRIEKVSAIIIGKQVKTKWIGNRFSR